MPATSVNTSGQAPGDRSPHTTSNPSVAALQLLPLACFQLGCLSVVILFDGFFFFF